MGKLITVGNKIAVTGIVRIKLDCFLFITKLISRDMNITTIDVAKRNNSIPIFVKLVIAMFKPYNS